MQVSPLIPVHDTPTCPLTFSYTSVSFMLNNLLTEQQHCNIRHLPFFTATALHERLLSGQVRRKVNLLGKTLQAHAVQPRNLHAAQAALDRRCRQGRACDRDGSASGSGRGDGHFIACLSSAKEG